MTRKHFQAFADEIRQDLKHRTINMREAKYAARMIATVCRQFNSRFDAHRFYAACGFNVEDM